MSDLFAAVWPAGTSILARKMRPSPACRGRFRVDLLEFRIDRQPDAPPRLVPLIGIATDGLDERLQLRAVEAAAHDAHALPIAPI
jgi:hypothetical protein